MGAVDFYCDFEGKSVSEAFHNAVEDAYYWHGHSGYTGTICEKPGYIVMDFDRKLSDDEAYEVYEELLSSYISPTPRLVEIVGGEARAKLFADLFNDKWQDAIAIELRSGGWFFCGMASE